MPDNVCRLLISVPRDFRGELETGALVVVEESRSRVRILPLSLPE